ncbi:Replication protein 15 [Acidithiobacillus sp. GGI-221]|nr:Replication protein 15 [Acidithiobacillus sp. GGI-221]
MVQIFHRYQRDAAQLSLIEHGAYRLLLDQAYLSGGTLPANPERIFRLLGAINLAEQEAIKSVLTEFFHKGRDGYTHARVTKEVDAYLKSSAIHREAGARGGRPAKPRKDLKEDRSKPNENQVGYDAGTNLDSTENHTNNQFGSEDETSLVSKTVGNRTKYETDGFQQNTRIDDFGEASQDGLGLDENGLNCEDDFWLDTVQTHIPESESEYFQCVVGENGTKPEATGNQIGCDSETNLVLFRGKDETKITTKPEPSQKASQNTEYRIKEEKIATGVRKRTAVAPEPAPTTATWEAYSQAYQKRYGTEPVRNQKVNGQLSNLVKRLGQDEAPAVAAFFVNHNGLFYVRGMHQVDLLLRDAEKLRTEWVTRQQPVNRQPRSPGAPQSSNNSAPGRASIGSDALLAPRPTVVRL